MNPPVYSKHNTCTLNPKMCGRLSRFYRTSPVLLPSLLCLLRPRRLEVCENLIRTDLGKQWPSWPWPSPPCYDSKVLPITSTTRWHRSRLLLIGKQSLVVCFSKDFDQIQDSCNNNDESFPNCGNAIVTSATYG